jgi:hypothetical protein
VLRSETIRSAISRSELLCSDTLRSEVLRCDVGCCDLKVRLLASIPSCARRVIFHILSGGCGVTPVCGRVRRFRCRVAGPAGFLAGWAK